MMMGIFRFVADKNGRIRHQCYDAGRTRKDISQKLINKKRMFCICCDTGRMRKNVFGNTLGLKKHFFALPVIIFLQKNVN